MNQFVPFASAQDILGKRAINVDEIHAYPLTKGTEIITNWRAFHLATIEPTVKQVRALAGQHSSRARAYDNVHNICTYNADVNISTFVLPLVQGPLVRN